MTLNQVKSLYQEQLAPLYPENEIHSILQIVCEDLLNWSRSDFMIKDREELNHLQEEILQKSLRELRTSKPVQYITGKAHFYGHVFAVNEHTLIPRQETEELVDMIIKDHKAETYLNIIDIGTGTGCIMINPLKPVEYIFEPIEYYNMAGQKVIPDATGIYIASDGYIRKLVYIQK